MPPEGYTTVTINEETAEQISVFAAEHDIESTGDAIAHAVDMARATEEDISDAELARLLYERLAD